MLDLFLFATLVVRSDLHLDLHYSSFDRRLAVSLESGRPVKNWDETFR